MSFNLDTLEAEAKGEPFPFTAFGEEFILPASSELDWRAAAALDRGDLEGGLRGALGNEQYAKFIKHPLPNAKMRELLKAYLAHLGTEPGESPASTS